MSDLSRLILVPCLIVLSACANRGPEVRRLSPPAALSRPPQECRLVSVMPGLPAEKAGLRPGDLLVEVNGQKPKDAWAAGEIVNESTDTLRLTREDASGARFSLNVELRKTRPRLGAACDLTGYRRQGVTSAGNESQTVFEGPYAFTASGIVDKGMIFVRVRLANHSGRELPVDPAQVKVSDASGMALEALTPKQVICDLFGDRGARQFAVKMRRRSATDQHPMASSIEMAREETCSGFAGGSGRLKGADASFVEANADYLARESFWPTMIKPGEAADGLIFRRETTRMPVKIQIEIDGKLMEISLGSQGPAEVEAMSEADLAQFFRLRKKNDPLRLVMKKNNRVFVGKFSTYDAIEETVWFDTPSGRIFNTTSIPLRSIQAAQTVDTQTP